MKHHARSVLCAMFCVVGFAMLTGCSSKVWVMYPPAVNLAPNGRIGLVEFSSTDPALAEVATQRFQSEVLAAQPGVGLIELGDEGALLRSVGRERLDAEAARMIAERHGVDALFAGELELSKVMPRVDFSSSFIEVRGRAGIDVGLRARLVECAGGATVWSDSCRGNVTIARGILNSKGKGAVGVVDPEGSYSSLIDELASAVTVAFRPVFVKRRLEDLPPTYVPAFANGVEVWGPPAQVASVGGE